MTTISRHALLLSLTCLTAVPAQAETVTTGEILLDLINNNPSDGTVAAELSGDITLSQDIVVNGTVTVDGGESKHKVDANAAAAFSVGENAALTLKNTTLENFTKSVQTGSLIENNKGTVVLDNIEMKNGRLTSVHNGETYEGSNAYIRNIEGEMSINGEFEDNQTETAKYANGGFFINYNGHVANMSGTYTDNFVKSTSATSSGWARGGILWQGGSKAVIDEMAGMYKNNHVYAQGDSAQGGVMYLNHGKITNINATFEGNTAETPGVYAEGGVIYNKGTIDNISGTFNRNGTIGNGASGSGGGVIANVGTITKIENAVFSENYAIGSSAKGGAINNSSGSSDGKPITIVNSSFTDNYANSTSGTNAMGGAIYSKTDLTIKASDGKSSEFRGNYIQLADGTKTNNAIYMNSKLMSSSQKGNIKLDATTGGKIVFDDAINGVKGYTITVTGDQTGMVAFNNKIENAASVTSDNVVLALGTTETSSADLTGVNLIVNSGILDLQNDHLQTVNVGTLTTTDKTGLRIDVDLESGKSDQIVASSIASGSKISLNNINIIKDGEQSVTVFSDGKAPEFINLDNFAAYTADYSYTFKSDAAGVLSTDEIIRNLKGLNAAVSDEENQTRSYSLSEERNVFGHLGELKGGENAVLTINGNNKILSGLQEDGTSSYNGMIVLSGQKVTFDKVSSIEDFTGEDGGFIKNSGELNIVNSSLRNNSATGNGGAIWSDGVVNVTATDGNSSEFSGNTANGEANAIYMADAKAQLNIKADGGNVTFLDSITGVGGYNIKISGTDEGKVTFNHNVLNAGLVDISSSHVYMDKESRLNGNNIALNGGVLHLDNGTLSSGASYKKLTGNGGELHIDVDTANKRADEIAVENLSGTVNVVGHEIAADNVLLKSKASNNDAIKFAEVAEESDGAFKVLRVEGNIYEWQTNSEKQADGTTNWTMSIKKADNNSGSDNKPEDARPVAVAEVASYLSLNAAGFEQTRDLVRNVENKVAASMAYNQACCGYYDNAYNGKPLYNLWVSPVYSAASIDTPSKFDADIYGLEAGGDLQHDVYNRLGVFVSYRHGEYDIDGKNDYFLVQKSSDIEIDSYLAGLYYRYNNRNFHAMATAFGGIQNADIKTADGIKSDSDATEFGASVSAGYSVVLPTKWIVEPQVAATYTQIEWDNIRDQYRKSVNFDAASQLELEAGVKFEKAWTLNSETAKFYVKPSVVQIFSDNDKVQIANQAKLNSLDDHTLGRVVTGMSYQLNSNLNIFGNAGYTFGSNYENVSVNAGLNWAF